MSQKTGRHPNPQTVAFPNKGNEIFHGGFLLGPHFRNTQLLKFLSTRQTMLALKQFSSTWIPPDSRLQQFWDLLCVFDAICSWVCVVVSLDSVGNGTQEVERSGRRSCCPSSLALAFLIKSCLAHLVMSACPQMIIVTGPELSKVSKSQKWRNAPSLDEL